MSRANLYALTAKGAFLNIKFRYGSSIADALGVSIGFFLALLIISFLRESLGTGSVSLFGVSLFTLPVLGENPMTLFILAPGAFLIMALLLALFRRMGVMKCE
ncbi:unnamed protein product [marine sediment metagenome]|uniref:Uncharacterized protein n=1 Tax=marine sediment metagenome TaxID=412755 RepID=X1TPQ5_9ZZZZ